MSSEDYSFFEIMRDRIVWTVVLGAVSSAVLYIIHLASGWPHDLPKACLIATGMWAVIAWIIVDNAD